MNNRRVVVIVTATAAAGASLVAAAFTGVAAPAPAVAAVTTTPAPAHCARGSHPDTGIDGQVPVADRVSGRAAQGYSCNLRLVGGLQSTAAVTFDTYRDCAYFSDAPGGSGIANGSVVVADMRDPRHPRVTDHLTARAFSNPGESLRVNARRGLLVGDHYDTLQANPDQFNYIHYLAVYDVRHDCRHPRLLADVKMPRAAGHEGCFQPDGKVYYMSSVMSQGFTPIDLSDPRHPRELSGPWQLPYPHGCSTSDDGKVGYFSNTLTGGIEVVDTSQAQARRRNASFRVLSIYPTPDDLTQQSSVPITYHGRRHLLVWAE